MLPLCAAATLLVLSGCSVELYHGLPEQDANDIYVLLQEKGINATKSTETGGNVPTYMISVPKSDAPQASRYLKEYGLPRPRVSGLSMFKERGSMIPTATEERAMLHDALAGEVSEALRKVDGVLDARAIVMVAEKNDLAVAEGTQPKNSAAVVVKYYAGKAEQTEPPISEVAIKAFVSRALPDITPENVNVILTPARPLEIAPATADEQQYKDVLGMRVHASSATMLKLVLAISGVLILALAAFSVLQMMKAGQAPAAGRSRSRARPEA